MTLGVTNEDDGTTQTVDLTIPGGPTRVPELSSRSPMITCSPAFSPLTISTCRGSRSPTRKAESSTPHGQVVRATKSTAQVRRSGAVHGIRQKKAKTLKSHKANARGRGAQKKHYVGDASVAARHVKVAHTPPRAHAHTGSHHRRVRTKAERHQLPGPFDTTPPGHANGK